MAGKFNALFKTKKPVIAMVHFGALPGAPLYARNPDLATLRLSFATVGLEKIEEGVGRLAQGL